MTRAVHWRRDTERQSLGTFDCGTIRYGAASSRDKRKVTCKRCLKLIGKQQPSGAALTCEACTCDTCRNFKRDPRSKSSGGCDKIDAIVDAGEKACEFYEPSSPSTDRASAVKVELHATVGNVESKRPTLTYVAQEDIVLINWANGEISAYVPESRLARLEQMLRDVVGADDELRETHDLFDSNNRLASAIEAARREISK
jgi:hypothetical protein